ncbi:hypothetical protein NPIL_296621 [Nephila pilipes]|uniref:Uncharacterized protein n=1 Tax=Nephila pilipes TaxID=299642 RepID=A0A8X6QEE2_NEPPI|nr:hypothetical protein NPIL_296621 [Nephila pilipes]
MYSFCKTQKYDLKLLAEELTEERLQLAAEPAVNVVRGFRNQRGPAETYMNKLNIEFVDVKKQDISIYNFPDNTQPILVLEGHGIIFLILLIYEYARYFTWILARGTFDEQINQITLKSLGTTKLEKNIIYLVGSQEEFIGDGLVRIGNSSDKIRCLLEVENRSKKT